MFWCWHRLSTLLLFGFGPVLLHSIIKLCAVYQVCVELKKCIHILIHFISLSLSASASTSPSVQLHLNRMKWSKQNWTELDDNTETKFSVSTIPFMISFNLYWVLLSLIEGFQFEQALLRHGKWRIERRTSTRKFQTSKTTKWLLRIIKR